MVPPCTHEGLDVVGVLPKTMDKLSYIAKREGLRAGGSNVVDNTKSGDLGQSNLVKNIARSEERRVGKEC